MKNFSRGDRVEVLDDALSGEVVHVEAPYVTIETSAGFQLVFEENELIKIPGEDAIKIDRFSLQSALEEKQIATKNSKRRAKPKERNAVALEVDLHIHQLTNSTKNKSSFDLLNLQLETAKRQLDFAIRKRIQKVVFIHGVGEGVLRTELETLFKRYENLKFYDADYQKYGMGATEVYIFQNQA
ncbi:MAG TPA: Smr/MutS family protein [Flavobacteriaceae bacterium]|nr:Smr/MutS family protein [Flavobacteriaceae bacterium]